MKNKLWLPGFLGMAVALALLHRYGRHSGATSTEHKQILSGDAVIPDPDLVITNAITIHAPPEAIWPWLVQLGYYRGGLLYRGRHGIKPAGILSYIPIPTFVFCSPNPSARMRR